MMKVPCKNAALFVLDSDRALALTECRTPLA